MEKYTTKTIVFLLFILLVVCFVSLYMIFEKGSQEPLMIDIDEETIDKITNDIFAIKYKYGDRDSNGNYVIPKSVIDNMIDNIRSIKGINGNVKLG